MHRRQNTSNVLVSVVGIYKTKPCHSFKFTTPPQLRGGD